MNHQGGKLIYESCPAVCNVAGSLPFAIWVDPIRCDGSQKLAEGAVSKEKGLTNVRLPPTPPKQAEKANKLILHCDRKIIFAAV